MQITAKVIANVIIKSERNTEAFRLNNPSDAKKQTTVPSISLPELLRKIRHFSNVEL